MTTEVVPRAEDPIARQRRAVGIATVGVVGAGLLAAAIDPTHGPILCPFRLATGLDCPLCGATRAVHSFATGHPLRALDHNLLVGVLLPIAIVLLVVAVVASLRGRPVRMPVVPRAAWIGLAVVVGAFWVLRNIPAFGWLGSA